MEKEDAGASFNPSPVLCLTNEGHAQRDDRRPDAKEVRAPKKSGVLTPRDEKGISIPSVVADGQPHWEQ